MLPERNELRILRDQLAEMDETDEAFEQELDTVYLDAVFRSIVKGDGEDSKRLALMDFDVPAHMQLVRELDAEKQFETSRVIQWYLDEYARLFPTRNTYK